MLWSQSSQEPWINAWEAEWIHAEGGSPHGYEVQHFRRTFRIESLPESLPIHISADNRYILFVNGKWVLQGPSRGSLHQWHYETIDLLPYLDQGENVLAVVVWNHGAYAAEAQQSDFTGLLVQGANANSTFLNSNSEWLGRVNHAYRPLPLYPKIVPQYYVAGPGEIVDGNQYPWGWEQPGYDDSKWGKAVGPVAWKWAAQGERGTPYGTIWAGKRILHPTPIPSSRVDEPEPIPLRQVDGEKNLSTPIPLSIPPGKVVRLLFDQGFLTTAYPEFVISAGKDAKLKATYMESLYETNLKGKGHRDSLSGKVVLGAKDEFVSDGGRKRVFRPLWWRTYRYISVEIETSTDSLILESVQGRFTAYPFQNRTRWDAPEDPQLADILSVGVRTQQLCANETYMDCPYYEQLQYAGDTRIQQLVSLYAFGDSRLMRQAIDQVDQSRIPSGLSMSRYPTRVPQYIPGFSLIWIASVHDYWRYVPDEDFVKSKLAGVRAILDWHLNRANADGSLPFLPWWNFYDWAWKRGIPPMDEAGHSAMKDLLFLYALQLAVELEEALGNSYYTQRFGAIEEKLSQSIRKRYWDEKEGLIRDLPDSALYSQHANSFAVLTGIATEKEAKEVMTRVLDDPKLLSCNLGFFFYLSSAMRKSGLGNRYLETLEGWRRQLSLGLSTWVEEPDPITSRSDCHAWGCVPNIELIRTVLGIESAAPGFQQVHIQPHLGNLTEIEGEMPHPAGSIRVKMKYHKRRGLSADIHLPDKIGGVLEWKGKTYDLTPGKQLLEIK